MHFLVPNASFSMLILQQCMMMKFVVIAFDGIFFSRSLSFSLSSSPYVILPLTHSLIRRYFHRSWKQNKMHTLIFRCIFFFMQLTAGMMHCSAETLDACLLRRWRCASHTVICITNSYVEMMAGEWDIIIILKRCTISSYTRISYACTNGMYITIYQRWVPFECKERNILIQMFNVWTSLNLTDTHTHAAP